MADPCYRITVSLREANVIICNATIPKIRSPLGQKGRAEYKLTIIERSFHTLPKTYFEYGNGVATFEIVLPQTEEKFLEERFERLISDIVSNNQLLWSSVD